MPPPERLEADKRLAGALETMSSLAAELGSQPAYVAGDREVRASHNEERHAHLDSRPVAPRQDVACLPLPAVQLPLTFAQPPRGLAEHAP